MWNPNFLSCWLELTWFLAVLKVMSSFDILVDCKFVTGIDVIFIPASIYLQFSIGNSYEMCNDR